MAAGDTFVFDAPTVMRLDKMLEWFENVGRLLDTPRYRRQLPNPPVPMRMMAISTGELHLPGDRNTPTVRGVFNDGSSEYEPDTSSPLTMDDELRIGIGRPNASVLAGSLPLDGEWNALEGHFYRWAFAVASGTITAADGTTPGVGSVTIWWLNAVSGLLEAGPTVAVKNFVAAPFVNGTRLITSYQPYEDAWWITNAPQSALFGVVQSGFANASGATSLTVSIKSSDYLGNNVIGNAFDTKTELKPCSDTNLIAGNAVRYRVLSDGTRLIVSDIWDLPIGRIVWESLDKTNLRQGWRLCDGTQGAAFTGNSPDLSGRFIMSLNTAGLADEDGIGDTGGIRAFTVSNVNYGDSAPDVAESVVDTIDEKGDNANLDPDEVDNAPPYYVMAALQRCDQRA